MNIGLKAIILGLLLDLLAFAALFGASALTFSPDQVIPSFALRWEALCALEGLFRFLPFIHFLALALVYGSSKGLRGETLGKSAAPILILCVVSAAAILLLEPGLASGKSSISSASLRFNQAFSDAREALQKGKIDEARSVFGILESIDRDDSRLASFESGLLGARLKAERQANLSSDSAAARHSSSESEKNPGSAKGYYLKALDFYDKQDFYSAHWFASLAQRLDPSLQEARRLTAKAWEGISSKKKEGDKRSVYYARKIEAYGMLRSEDYVSAYRLFGALASESANDPDIVRYFEEARAGLERSSFFIEEAENAAKLASSENFFAVIPANDGRKRAIMARAAAFVSGTAYFFDLEIIESASNGEAALHFRCDYAKLANGRLSLVAVAKNRPSESHKPIALASEKNSADADSADSAGSRKLPSALEFELDTETARNIGLAGSSPKALDLLAALKTSTEAASFGIDPEPLLIELQRRLGIPFYLFGGCALGALIGLRFRKESEKPKLGSWLALPLMAASVIAVSLFMERAEAIIAQWIAASFDAGISLSISAAMRTIVLLIAIAMAVGPRHAAAEGDEA